MKGLVARMQDVAIRQSEELLKNVAGVRDGDADAIHDARVATRRIRALLEVLGDDHDANHVALAEEMRGLGRSLGAARDLDVVVDLFEEKIWQVPEAARAVAALNRAAVHERATARRELIRTIERSPLGEESLGRCSGTLEEILTGEILARTWTAVALAHDRRWGACDAGPAVRSVLAGHAEARHRALKMIVAGEPIASGRAAALNQLRRRCERWTDMLLGFLPPGGEASDLARLSRCGINAFLIGESLMRQSDVEAATRAILRKPATAPLKA